MRSIGRAVAVMALLTALCSLFGCKKVPQYTAEDIRSVSVSCGHMDYSHSYSFYLRETESGWLLDADFAMDTEQPHVEFEARPVAEENVKELLSVVQEQEVIAKLQRWKKPRWNVRASDETSYYTSIMFADGEMLGAATHVSDALVSCFYTIAAKICGE